MPKLPGVTISELLVLLQRQASGLHGRAGILQ
jgi:hypothetical protein